MTSSWSGSQSRNPCDFERPSMPPGSHPSSLSLLSTWNQNNLRLLHHYWTMTSGSLSVISRAGVERILQYDLPQLAFQHDFMMHCLLGIASLHLHHLAPNVLEHQSLAITHRVHAMSGLRKAISQPSKESYRAILAGSHFLLILSSDLSSAESDGDLWIGNWLGLWAGMRGMIKVTSWTYVEQSGLAPIFAKDYNPRTTLENLPVVLSDMLSSMDPDKEETRLISNTLECLSRLYEYLLLDGFGTELTTRVIAWPANTEIAGFSALAKQRQPQALVIAAYYLVFTKLVDGIWWMAEISGREIESIAKALPVEYHFLMIIPLQAVHLHDKWEILNLLLSQLPGGSPFGDDLRRASKLQFGREILPLKGLG